MTRWKVLAVAGLCVALLAAGCGRRGALERPSAPETPAQAAATVNPQPSIEPEPEPDPANNDFFLDFLI